MAISSSELLLAPPAGIAGKQASRATHSIVSGQLVKFLPATFQAAVRPCVSTGTKGGRMAAFGQLEILRYLFPGSACVAANAQAGRESAARAAGQLRGSHGFRVDSNFLRAVFS